MPVTDPYIKVVNAIIGAVQTLTTYFPKAYQVTMNRAEISKGADYWFLLDAGAFSDTRLDSHESIVQWTTQCELAVKFSEYETRMTNFLECRGAVRAILKSPHALRGIRLKPPVVVTGGELRQDVAGLNPNWIIQPITVIVNQYVDN